MSTRTLFCLRCTKAFPGRQGLQEGYCSLVCAFEAQTAPPDANGCRRWNGHSSPNGYGHLWWEGKNHPATHVARKLAGLDTDTSLDVMHSCHNEWCVEVSHVLEQGTRAENMNTTVTRERRNATIERRNAGILRLRAALKAQEELKDASTKEARRRETEYEASRTVGSDAGSSGRPTNTTSGPEHDASARDSPGRSTSGDATDASREGHQGLEIGGSHAAQEISLEESSQREHPDRNQGRQAAEAGRRDRVGNSAESWWREAAAKGAVIGPRASPDLVGICRTWGLIVEAKLSVTPQAEEQLKRYKEICANVWPGRRWVLVQAARNWRAGVPYWVVGPGSWERASRMVAWHFQAA